MKTFIRCIFGIVFWVAILLLCGEQDNFGSLLLTKASGLALLYISAKAIEKTFKEKTKSSSQS